jgi:hypothetical protein
MVKRHGAADGDQQEQSVRYPNKMARRKTTTTEPAIDAHETLLPDDEAYCFRLPTELVEIITPYPTRLSLLAMRLVSRDTMAKVQRAMTATFEEKRFLMTSARSMNALVAISEHAIFAKAMRHINLEAGFTDEGDSPEANLGLPAREQQDGDREWRAKVRSINAVRRDQAGYWCSREFIHTVHEALTNLSRVGTKPLILRLGDYHDHHADLERRPSVHATCVPDYPYIDPVPDQAFTPNPVLSQDLLYNVLGSSPAIEEFHMDSDFTAVSLCCFRPESRGCGCL